MVGYLWEGEVNNSGILLYFETTPSKKISQQQFIPTLHVQTSFRSSLVQYYSIGPINNQTYFRVRRVLKCPPPQLSTQCLSSCCSIGCQPWPSIGMTWGALKIPVLGPHLSPVVEESPGVGPRHRYFLNLLWWLQCAVKVKSHCFIKSLPNIFPT